MGFVVWWRHASWWTRVNIWEGDGLVTRKPRLKLVFLSLSLSKALYSAIWKAIWSIMHVIEPRRRRSSSMLILVICLSVVLFDGAGTLPRCLGSNRKVIWFLLFDACDWLFNWFGSYCSDRNLVLIVLIEISCFYFCLFGSIWRGSSPP